MDEMDEMILCASCRYFDPADNERLDGLCRARNPRMQGDIAPHGNAMFQVPEQAIWPRVNADDWCGDHIPSKQQ